MIQSIVQLGIIGIWSVVLVTHTRRLIRLAHLESVGAWHDDKTLRIKLTRVWWWLGREEYWREVQKDGIRCLQLTLMVFALTLGLHS